MADRLIINCQAYLKGVGSIFYGVNFPLAISHAAHTPLDFDFGFKTRHNLRLGAIAFRHIHHHAERKTEQRNNHGGGQHIHNLGLNIVECADHIILKAPRPCAVMQAKGKTPRTAYHARRVWVFQKHIGAGQ